MVAQEDRPLAVVRDVRRLPQDVGDREAVFLGDGHVHARHQREVKGHVAFVAGAAVFAAEVQLGVLRPLVGLGQQHAVGVIGVDLGAYRLEHRVGLGQVLVVGAVTLDQVGNRVRRRPSMPMSSQKRMTASTAFITCGLSKFRSGWWE